MCDRKPFLQRLAHAFSRPWQRPLGPVSVSYLKALRPPTNTGTFKLKRGSVSRNLPLVLIAALLLSACVAAVLPPAEFGSTWSHENPAILIDQPAPWVKPPLLTRAVFAAGLPNDFQICWQTTETPQCVTLGYLREEGTRDSEWTRCPVCLVRLRASDLIDGRCYFCRNLVRRPQFGWAERTK